MFMKRTCIIIVLVFMVPISLFFIFKFVKGYYPLPMMARKVYWVCKDEIGEVNSIIIDKNFKFSEEGYKVGKNISSPYPLPLALILEPHINDINIPADYKFRGIIKIEITRDKKIVYSNIIDEAKNMCYYNNQGKPVSVGSFRIIIIPLPLAGKSHKNIDLNITVLKPETDLLKYVDSAELYLYPDLRL